MGDKVSKGIRHPRVLTFLLIMLLGSANATPILALNQDALPPNGLPNSKLQRAAKKKSLPEVLSELSVSKLNFASAIEDVEDLLPTIESAGEARMVCDLLKLLPRERPGHSQQSELRAILSIVRETENQQALAVLSADGAGQLCRIVDASNNASDRSEIEGLLLALEMLAKLRSKEGLDRILNLARNLKGGDAYEWRLILMEFEEDHPLATTLVQEFRKSLPTSTARLALLQWFNSQAIDKTTIGKQPHPFDSPEGFASLRGWISSKDPETFDQAISATVALAFVTDPEREKILALTQAHPDVNLRLEGAWACGMWGDKAGITALQQFCRDYRYSKLAASYLTELGHKNDIPRETKEPEFDAKAEFAQWLAHPNELGKAPDELEIVDQRNLRWPTESTPKAFWLLKYRVNDPTGLGDDDIGVGLVGSSTFCFFSMNLELRAPEDAYAIHCFWEMKSRELISELKITPNAGRSNPLLKQWEGAPLEKVECLKLIALSNELKYPAKNVSLYAAERKGEKGWFLLDGPRSRWYGESEFPPDSDADDVAKVHIGRRLLGFEGEPDRRAFLKQKGTTAQTPEQVVAAYENLIVKLDTCEEYEKRALFKNELPFGKHFDRYLDAATQVNGANRTELAITVFEKLLSIALEASPETREVALNTSFGPFPLLLDQYVGALKTSGKTEKIDTVIAKLAPHWDHNFGYGLLGGAAFRSGRFTIAEPLLTKLKPSLQTIYNTSELDMLAEIWSNSGRKKEAQTLTMDCLAKLNAESKEASDKEERSRIEKKFQEHLATLRRLFPTETSDLLKTNKLPETTLVK